MAKQKQKMPSPGYVGRIGNAGSQKVEAPFAAKTKAKGTVTKDKNRD